jgi:beta-glucosidase
MLRWYCCNAGSVLSGGGSVPAPKASPAIWMNMVDEIQKSAMSTRLQIPMIYGIDAVHGHSNVYGATIFPHNVGLGATRQVEYQLFLSPFISLTIIDATAWEKAKLFRKLDLELVQMFY